MSDSSSMMLIGIGGGGSAIARGVRRAFGEGLRFLAIDTDAASAADCEDFLLLGGNRLSGRGSGGDVVAARLATEDSINSLDPKIEGVRLAIIVTAATVFFFVWVIPFTRRQDRRSKKTDA